MRFLPGSEFAEIQTKNRSICENAVTGRWGGCLEVLCSVETEFRMARNRDQSMLDTYFINLTNFNENCSSTVKYCKNMASSRKHIVRIQLETNHLLSILINRKTVVFSGLWLTLSIADIKGARSRNFRQFQYWRYQMWL